LTLILAEPGLESHLGFILDLAYECLDLTCESFGPD